MTFDAVYVHMQLEQGVLTMIDHSEQRAESYLHMQEPSLAGTDMSWREIVSDERWKINWDLTLLEWDYDSSPHSSTW